MECERQYHIFSFLPDFNHKRIMMYVLNFALSIYTYNLTLKQMISIDMVASIIDRKSEVFCMP